METGGCPHVVIRENVSPSLAALGRITMRIQSEYQEEVKLLRLCESGGVNIAANFRPDLAVTRYKEREGQG